MRLSIISKVARAFALLCALWAVLDGLAVYKTHATKAKAESFLAELRQLEVGQSTMESVARLADKYQGEWHKTLSSESVPLCGSGPSVVDFVFENQWMRWFLFAPLTRFSATLYVKDNLLCYRSAGIFDTVGGFTGFNVEEFRESPIPSSFPFHSFSSRLMLVKALVTMDVGATAAERTASYSINLDCLTKLRGCQDTKEMAPAIWQNSREVGPTLWKSQFDKY